MNPRPVWRATPETDAFIKQIFATHKGTIAINAIFNIDTDPQLWYEIPGFNGYEMSDYGLVRSMKYFQRLPFGMLIKFSGNEIYILSNNNNDRIKVPRKDLWDLVVNNPNPTPGYPRTTSQTDCYSRNKRMFLCDHDLPLYGTRGYGKNGWKKVKKHVQTNKQETTFFPQFTIIPDNLPTMKEGAEIDVLEFRKKE